MCFRIVKEYAALTHENKLKYQLLSFGNITANNTFHTLLDRLCLSFVTLMLSHCEAQALVPGRFPSTILLSIVLVFQGTLGTLTPLVGHDLLADMMTQHLLVFTFRLLLSDQFLASTVGISPHSCIEW